MFLPVRQQTVRTNHITANNINESDNAPNWIASSHRGTIDSAKASFIAVLSGNFAKERVTTTLIKARIKTATVIPASTIQTNLFCQ